MRWAWAATASVALGVVVFVSTLVWLDGAYYESAAGGAGIVVIGGAAVTFLLGFRPSRAIVAAAGALLLMGVWAVVSTRWGGLPHTSLRFLGLTLTGAGALVLGAALGQNESRRDAAALAVGGGLTAACCAVLVIVASGRAPDVWFLGRQLAGPVGYHNALGSACVIGLPIALWAAASASRGRRAVGAAAGVLLLATALLTQSRGTFVAGAAAILVQAVLARRFRPLAAAAGLAACAALLLVVLRDVDRALVLIPPEGSLSPEAEASLRRFVLVTAACAVTLAIAALPRLPSVGRPSRRRIVPFAAAAAALVAAGAVAAFVSVGGFEGLLDRVRQQPNDVSQTTGGATRYTSLSTSGRVAQWRVAWKMTEEEPLRGAGVGTFSRRFTLDRDHKDLYVLQPHSIELELLAELGVVACVAFLVFAGAAAIGLHGGDRGLSAAVAGSFAGFLVIASVDWVFSFPGLVVPMLLLVGIATGGSRRRVPSLAATGAALALTLVALGAVAAPALAERRLEGARETEPRSVDDAWKQARAARDLSPWDPRIVRYQGLLAERLGRFRTAAELYARAAELSPQPWTDTFRRARALRRGGFRRESARVCLLAHAQNPLEPGLTRGVCEDVRA